MQTIPLARAPRCVGPWRDAAAPASGIVPADACRDARGNAALRRHAPPRRCAILATFIFASLLPHAGNALAAAADPVVGSVLAVRGAVFLEAATGQQALVAKAPVHRGDTIVCAAGKAQISLSDGSIVSIGENSRMRVAEYDRAGDITTARIGLLSGVLRLVVNKLSPSGKFEVETETAVAAVRGTDWVIESTPAQTSVALVSGVVAVAGRNEHAGDRVVLDASGQGTDVRPGIAPTPVARWGAQRFEQTLARATFE